MKPGTRIKLTAAGGIFVLLAACLALVACGSSGGGGGQSAGVGGTGIAVGKITQFGSIYVNGDRYKTKNSRFIVDGNTNASQDDLEIGMVVRVKFKTANGKPTGEAIEVFYDDEVQGPIDSAPVEVPGSGGTQKTFTVFGLTITVDEVGTIFEDTSFDTLAANDVVEISGFRTGPDAITATYVEWKETLTTGSEVEIRGNIENLVAGPLPTFEIRGIDIITDINTEIEVPGGMLENDLFVEVEGTVTSLTPLTILAEEIEFEEEGFGENVDDVSLQGLISDYVDIGDFKVNGLPVDASGAVLEPANAAALLENGVEVEVEGDIVGGVLIADELELREGDSELRAFVNTVDVGDSSFTVSYPVLSAPFDVVIRVDGQTVFEDETGAVPATPPFSLDDLNPGGVDFVRIEGREVNGEVVADTVKRRSDADDSLKLEGFVDAHDPGVSITILGIVYGVDGATSYEPDPPDITAGDLVEIEDENDPLPADGIADEVEEEI